MKSERAKNIIRPDLKISWAEGRPKGDDSTEAQKAALVLIADKDTTLNAMVELLVEQWDLPVWQDEPIAYDLSTPEGKMLDLDQDLGQLKQSARLQLVPARNRLVMAQSPADIPVFEVWHPDAMTSLSVLAIAEELTPAELERELVRHWQLPDEELAFYELRLPDGTALPQNSRLSDLVTVGGSRLMLAREEGIRVLPDEEIDDALSALAAWSLSKSPDTGISEEQLLALVRAMVPKEELEGREEEFLAFVRQSWEDVFSDDLTGPDASAGGEEEVIEIVVPSELVLPAEPESSTEMSELQFRKHLFTAMEEGLDESDLEHLLFCLDVDSEKFTGNKSKRIIGVIQYYRRRNKLGELLAELFENASHVKDSLDALGCQAWLP